LTIATIAALLLPLAGPLQSQPAPLDTLVDVGGYHLHMVVYRGTQPLTIVMESGGGASLAAWSGVEARLAERTGATVVVYDRAGFGESGVGPAELTPRQQIRQLDEALERLRTAPDRIVVGHSYGGLLALLHAHLYPRRVRGVVLVDPMNVVEEGGHRPRVARQPPDHRQCRAASTSRRGGRIGPRHSRDAPGGDRAGGAVADR
jgi:pimeloyl-ACP methyl ester carboxylesterase